MKYSKIEKKCQFSRKKDLKNILSLGFLPAVNGLEKINNKKDFEPFFSTNLMYSPSSKLFQLDNILDKTILFPKSYPYTSSTTKVLRDNFKDLSLEVQKKIKIQKNDLVVDIGSNDGNLLSNFKNFRVQGVTPEKIGYLAIKKGIPTIIDYFNAKSVNKIIKKKGKAKVITATNVFAHIDDINSLMKNVLKLLDQRGVFITESHYFLDLMQTLQYDTIYHEHLRYYTLQSLSKIFNKFGLKIIFSKKIKTHGGSIRVYAMRKKFKKVFGNVSSLLKAEKRFINKKNIDKFRERVVDTKIKTYSLLNSIKIKGKKIFGVGAPSRATTLVNYLGLDQNILENICEIKGSHKIGFYLPGTKIPIVDEKEIFKNPPDYLFLLSWHIKDELIKNLKKKGFKGKFIIPLPTPRVIN